MTANPPVNPFDPNRRMGTICEVGQVTARMILSDAASESAEVGRFVVIECGEFLLFARITSVTSESGKEPDSNGMAAIEFLTTMRPEGEAINRGLTRLPHPGSEVYSAPPELLRWLFECSQTRDSQTREAASEPIMLNVGALADGTEVRVTPELLFGRHCAVLGATGAGKSWTFARLIEEAARHSAKVVLFDATGEFETLRSDAVRHFHIGDDSTGQESSDELVMPYNALTESDLFALFKPAGPTQAPKLRAAIKSLKLAKVPQLAVRGVVLKAGRLKAPFESAYISRASEIEDPRANFDITKLPAQIDAECVFSSGGFSSSPDDRHWGGPNELERSNCVTLITRIEDMLQAPELACMFQPGNKRVIFDELDSFVADPAARVLRISLKHLPFSHNAREIVANALGRHVLEMGRGGKFRECPLLVFLDEAHHFLNKTLGEEDTRYPLDSFELIAKEGRKMSLNICISTQRPRDIPEGILSQMGTLVIHRLRNDRDRELVERASSDADRSAMTSIPELGDGQAVIVGVGFPISLPVQVTPPTQPPDSRGPDYQRQWQPQ
jgi:uncharacterized protein DUF87/helicase HerA-like protein